MSTASRSPAGASSVALWVAIAALFSMIVGLATGLFAALAGQRAVTAAGAGGATFVTVLTLALAVIALLAKYH